MVGFFDTDIGRVQISPTIVRRFIMNEVEKSKYFRLPGAKPGEPYSRKTVERAIRVNFMEGNVETTMTLIVAYGTRIIKEVRELQGKISRALQLGTGLNVRSIAINIENVYEDETMPPPLLIEPELIHADGGTP